LLKLSVQRRLQHSTVTAANRVKNYDSQSHKNIFIKVLTIRYHRTIITATVDHLVFNDLLSAASLESTHERTNKADFVAFVTTIASTQF